LRAIGAGRLPSVSVRERWTKQLPSAGRIVLKETPWYALATRDARCMRYVRRRRRRRCRQESHTRQGQASRGKARARRRIRLNSTASSSEDNSPPPKAKETSSLTPHHHNTTPPRLITYTPPTKAHLHTLENHKTQQNELRQALLLPGTSVQSANPPHRLCARR
jgi:hypothetical protein